MNEDYCNYDLSLALKEAGFDYPCYFYYTKENAPEGCVYHTTSEEAPIDYNRSIYAGCSMPLLSQAQKWLREKKRIAINVIAHDTSDKYREGKYHWEEVYLPNFSEEGHRWVDWFIYGKHPLFDTYEEALSDGLSQMLELIEKGE